MNTTPARPELLDAHTREQIDRALAQYQSQPGPLLQVLHAVQQRLRYIPEAAIPIIASALNLSRAEVHGVVTFYHHFRRHPPGKHVVQICQAESCKAMRGDELNAHAQQRLKIGFHETTGDGRITLENSTNSWASLRQWLVGRAEGRKGLPFRPKQRKSS